MIRLDKAVQQRVAAEFGITLPRAWVTRILQAGGVRYNGEVIKKKGFKLESLSDIERLELNIQIVEAVVNEYRTGQVSRDIASLWDNFAPINRFQIRQEYINAVPDIKDDIVFEDQDYTVLYKPPGIISHPAQNEAEDNMVYRYLKYMNSVHGNLPRAGLLHRLDKDTQGLMVFAKSMLAFNRLKEQFNTHQVIKVYLVFSKIMPHNLTNMGKKILSIAKGQSLDEFLELWSKVQVYQDADTGYRYTKNAKAVVDYIFSRPRLELYGYIAMYRFENKARFSLDPNQLRKKIFRKVKDAKSDIYPVGYINSSSVLVTAVRILTGRTHQIRAQMRYLGLPIMGDRLYMPVSQGSLQDSRLNLHLVSFILGFNSAKYVKYFVVLPKAKTDIQILSRLDRFGNN